MQLYLSLTVSNKYLNGFYVVAVNLQNLCEYNRLLASIGSKDYNACDTKVNFYLHKLANLQDRSQQNTITFRIEKRNNVKLQYSTNMR